MCVILHDLFFCGHEMETKVPCETALEARASASTCDEESTLADFSEDKCIQCKCDDEANAKDLSEDVGHGDISEWVDRVISREELSSGLAEEDIARHEDKEKKKTEWMKDRKREKRQGREKCKKKDEKIERENMEEGEDRMNAKQEDLNTKHEINDSAPYAQCSKSTIPSQATFTTRAPLKPDDAQGAGLVSPSKTKHGPKLKNEYIYQDSPPLSPECLPRVSSPDMEESAFEANPHREEVDGSFHTVRQLLLASIRSQKFIFFLASM